MRSLATDEVDLGELIRTTRSRRRMSQRALALRAGLSLRALREIERGRVRVPRQDSVERLAEALAEPRLLEHGPTTEDGGYAEDDHVEVRILGAFGAVRGEAALSTGTPKQQRLLALMALRANHPVSHAEIVDVLWGEDPPDSFNQLVHTYISRLRALLAPHQNAVGNPAIVHGHAGYELCVDPEQLDLLRFQQAVADADQARADEDPELEQELLKTALSLWRGSVLETSGETLVGHPLAVEYGLQKLDAALRLANLALAAHGYDEAIRVLRPLVHDQPLHEGLHLRLMLALAGAGQRVAALAVFRDLDRRLRTEFGIEPGEELQAVHMSVLTGRRLLVAPAPAPAMVG